VSLSSAFFDVLVPAYLHSIFREDLRRCGLWGVWNFMDLLTGFTRYAELDGAEIEKTRKSIPVSEQRRFEVYPDVSKGAVKYEEDP
jgi:hypothetical protein